MNIYIIGSGIVGLTIGIKIKKKLKGSKVTILEKEESSIKHGSGRNSGIIHSGVYYPSETLKAKLCIDGAKQLKNYVKNRKLWIISGCYSGFKSIHVSFSYKSYA